MTFTELSPVVNFLALPHSSEFIRSITWELKRCYSRIVQVYNQGLQEYPNSHSIQNIFLNKCYWLCSEETVLFPVEQLLSAVLLISAFCNFSAVLLILVFCEFTVIIHFYPYRRIAAHWYFNKTVFWMSIFINQGMLTVSLRRKYLNVGWKIGSGITQWRSAESNKAGKLTPGRSHQQSGSSF